MYRRHPRSFRLFDPTSTGGATPAPAPAGDLSGIVQQQAAEIVRLRALVPADGAVVLGAADAAAWRAYDGAGRPDVAALTTERDTARTEVQRMQRDALLRDVAEAAGYRFEVLRDRDAATNGTLQYTVATQQDGSKRVTVKAGADGAEQALADYATANWQPYLPALAPTAATPPATPAPTAWVPQPSGIKGSTPPSRAEQFQAARDAQGTSPFRT